MEKIVPKFIMVVGLPGAGKSSFLQSHFKDFNIYSSDLIRKELFNDINSQENNNLVFDTLHNRIREDLKNGVSCCYDATNIHKKYRKAFLETIKKIPCQKQCYIIATPIELCLERDENRDRTVGNAIIDKMYKNFDIPVMREGWDNVFICYTEDSRGYYNADEIFQRLKNIPQHNPHHTLSVGDHCMKTYENMKEIVKHEKGLDKNHIFFLIMLAMFHDLGK